MKNKLKLLIAFLLMIGSFMTKNVSAQEVNYLFPVDFPVHVALSGADIQDEKYKNAFQFELVDPEGNVIQTKNNEGRNINFDEFLLDARKGTQTYTVRQIAGNDENITYGEYTTYTYHIQQTETGEYDLHMHMVSTPTIVNVYGKAGSSFTVEGEEEYTLNYNDIHKEVEFRINHVYHYTNVPELRAAVIYQCRLPESMELIEDSIMADGEVIEVSKEGFSYKMGRTLPGDYMPLIFKAKLKDNITATDVGGEIKINASIKPTEGYENYGIDYDGEVTLRVTAPPIIDPPVTPDNIDDPNDIHDVKFQVITKDKGGIFKITGKTIDGKDVELSFTDENGEVVEFKMNPGSYVLSQVETPFWYNPIDDHEFKVTKGFFIEIFPMGVNGIDIIQVISKKDGVYIINNDSKICCTPAPNVGVIKEISVDDQPLINKKNDDSYVNKVTVAENKDYTIRDINVNLHYFFAKNNHEYDAIVRLYHTDEFGNDETDSLTLIAEKTQKVTTTDGYRGHWGVVTLNDIKLDYVEARRYVIEVEVLDGEKSIHKSNGVVFSDMNFELIKGDYTEEDDNLIPIEIELHDENGLLSENKEFELIDQNGNKQIIMVKNGKATLYIKAGIFDLSERGVEVMNLSPIKIVIDENGVLSVENPQEDKVIIKKAENKQEQNNDDDKNDNTAPDKDSDDNKENNDNQDNDKNDKDKNNNSSSNLSNQNNSNNNSKTNQTTKTTTKSFNIPATGVE